MQMSIHDNTVALLQNSVTIGDYRFVFALYHYDNGLAGDIEVMNSLSVPVVLLAENNLLEFDAAVVIKRGRAQNNSIINLKNNIAARNDYLIISLNSGNDYSLWQLEVFYRKPCPLIVFQQMYLDEVYIFLISVFADVLYAGILVNEARRDNTCRDSYHADSQKGYEYAEGFAHRSYRIDISVADRQQGGNRPPYSRKGIGENCGLSLMLKAVHTQAGSDHKYQNNENRGEQLLALAVDNLADNAEGIIVGIYSEKAEKPHYSEHSESDCAGREKYRQIIRQKRQHINYAFKGYQITFERLCLALFGIKIFRCPKAEHIIYSEKSNSYRLYRQEQTAIWGSELLKGIQNAYDKIYQYRKHVCDIVNPADMVIQNAYLNYLECAFSAVFCRGKCHDVHYRFCLC